MKFEDIKLTKPLLNALNEQGITEMTPIQEKAIPKVLAGTDVIGIAQTGTGNILAYLLPILRDLKFTESKHLRVLVLVPTSEFAVQVASEFEKLNAYMSTRTIAVYCCKIIISHKKAVYGGC